jgi:isoprenylcysteine carboxyl methyltransferase (ICMT) family protein YpbQ
MGELINLLFKTTVSTWAMLTKGREWLIAVQLVREHDVDKEIIFSSVGFNNIE